MYRALVVDDEEIVCRGLARFVKWEEHGFEAVRVAYSAAEAKEALLADPVDVVFTDVRMPDESGLSLLQFIQQEYPGIKTVMLSGFSEFSYVQQALRYGAFDYLTKPVNLDEVGLLLDRISQKFLEERQKQTASASRIEALLLSVAKGYSYSEELEALLPSMDQWYGLRIGILDHGISEEELNGKKQEIRETLEAVMPEVHILNNDVYELFVLFPCRDGGAVEKMAGVLFEMSRLMEFCAVGVSKWKRGVGALAEAYREAGRALRYQRAKEEGGLIYYKNVELCFSQNTPETQNMITELITQLTNPESRLLAASGLENCLEQLEAGGLSLTQAQTACIQCLVEMNSFLQGARPDNADLHTQLNESLKRLILCRDFFETRRCMTEYVEMVANKLNQEDAARLGKGVIREIQLFIRKHYGENITLNLLAQEFYLHPNYLSRLFKEKVGKNFIDYITEVRMEKARELLAMPEKRVADIGLMVGYDNPRYFSKVFKQWTGVTPSEYREGQRAPVPGPPEP